MNPTPLTRREALRTAALGALALPLLGRLASAADTKGAKAPKAETPVATPYPPQAADGREHGLRLRCATWPSMTPSPP